MTEAQKWHLIDTVWLGFKVKDAFEEIGLDYDTIWPTLDRDYCAFLIQVCSVAAARDRGCLLYTSDAADE